MFRRIGATWSQETKLETTPPLANAQFGSDVSIDRDALVVGAREENAGAGAAYVFRRAGSSWTQERRLSATNERPGASFGYSVAMSGDRIVVGAFNETSAATGINGNGGNQSFSQAGAAYVFFRNGSAWTQEAYLKASNTSVGAAFGFSVAISGATVLVGAVGEASSATGVDGDQSQSGALGAGAAYVFRRSGSTWMQEAYLKASNTQTKAFFGTSGAIDGDTLVVGADGESSSASGIDGDQSSTTASIAGAAYLFHRSAGKWTQLAYVKAPNPRPIASFGASVALSGEALVVGSPFESSAATGVNGNQGEASTFRGAAYLY